MTGPRGQFKGTILMEDMYGELLPAQEMADGWMGGVGKSLDRTLVIMDLISALCSLLS